MTEKELQEEYKKMSNTSREAVEEVIELDEQNLIDHAEQLFLEGKVDSAYVDYPAIDNSS